MKALQTSSKLHISRLLMNGLHLTVETTSTSSKEHNKSHKITKYLLVFIFLRRGVAVTETKRFHMAQQQRCIPAILFVLCLMLGELTSQQCGTEHYSVYQAMLKGHTFKRLQVRPNSIDCRQACMGDVRCQSYNYVIDEHICELNNRTREARPEHFVADHDRYYMTKGPKRGMMNVLSKPNYLVPGLHAKHLPV